MPLEQTDVLESLVQGDEEEKQRIISITDKLAASAADKKKTEAEWDEAYRIYESIPKPEEILGPNYIFLPETHSAVQTILARLEAATLTEPFVDFKALNDKSKESALLHGGLLNQQLKITKIYNEIEAWLWSLVVYGDGILKIIPKNINTMNYDIELRAVDNYDFYNDPLGRKIDNCEWIIELNYLSRREMEEYEGKRGYKNIDLALKTWQAGGLAERGTGDERRREIRGEPTSILRSTSKTVPGRPYEVIEYMTKNRIIKIVNQKVEIFNERHNLEMLPYIKVNNMPSQGKFWSTGDVKHIGPLNLIINRIKHQRFLNVSLVLNRMWLVTRDNGVNLKQMVSQPGGIFLQDNKGSIEPLVTPDVTASAYQEEQIYKLDIQRTSGVVDVAQGVNPSSRAAQTATGINLLQEASNQIFKKKLIHIAIAQGKLGEKMAILNRKYMPDNKAVEMVDVLGQKFIKRFMKSDMDGEFAIEGRANTFMENKTAMMNKWIQLYGMFLQDPMGDVKLRGIKKNIFKGADTTSLDDVLMTDQEYAIHQQQQQAAAQQQQQQQLQMLQQQQEQERQHELEDKAIDIEKERMKHE